MWRLLHDTLPVRSNLIKRGVQCDTRCAWCGLHVETVDHLFKECLWVVDAWAQSPLKIPACSLSSGCFSTWIIDLIVQGPEEKAALMVAIFHGFWFARNKKVFEGREVPLHCIFSKASKVDDGNWGIGIVARDSDGIVIAAATRTIETLVNVPLAEAMGLRLAMQFALGLSLEEVIFENDCKELSI
ncbi:Reverse transcriptase zinc-binding domain [Sesbania bispinosa]|nr:Reverse transcriptase zinc-binding domain [Sesbania bispinosa]